MTVWREYVACTMLGMSEEDRDFVRSQIKSASPKWVIFHDKDDANSERLRKLLPGATTQKGATA